MSAAGIGVAVRRKEDFRFVTGRGQYTDDISRPGQSYIHFVRSPYAHAHITSIDVSAAEQHPGVYGTLTGEEVAALTDPARPRPALRASLGAASSLEDVERLLSGLQAILARGLRWRYARTNGRFVPDPDPRSWPEPGFGPSAPSAGRPCVGV